MWKWFMAIALAITGQTGIAKDTDGVLGVWRLLSYEIEFQDNGERRKPFGESPTGYLILTPEGRMMGYMEAKNRPSPKTDEARIAAYNSMLAYTGKYRIDGDKWITKADGSWNVDWVGGDQERHFRLEDEKLHIVSQWNFSRFYGNKMVRGILVWERDK